MIEASHYTNAKLAAWQIQRLALAIEDRCPDISTHTTLDGRRRELSITLTDLAAVDNTTERSPILLRETLSIPAADDDSEDAGRAIERLKRVGDQLENHLTRYSRLPDEAVAAS